MGERDQVDPGVVDPGTQPPLPLGRVGGPAVIVVIGDVADDWKEVFTQVACGLLQGLPVTVEAGYGVTVAEQAHGHGQPDSVGGPGDDGRPYVGSAHSGGISA